MKATFENQLLITGTRASVDVYFSRIRDIKRRYSAVIARRMSEAALEGNGKKVRTLAKGAGRSLGELYE